VNWPRGAAQKNEDQQGEEQMGYEDYIKNMGATDPTTDGIYLKSTKPAIKVGGDWQLDPQDAPGKYLVEIERLKMQFAEWQKKWFFVAEFKILESNVASLPVGTKAGWILKCDDKMFQQNLKRFLMALGNETDPAQVTEKTVALAVSEGQPFKGDKIRVDVATILTKTEKKPFSKHNWYPADAAAAAA
jgi:hypothetical protein